MPSSSKDLNAKRVNDSLKGAGSFWSEGLRVRDQALHLVDACYRTNILSMLDRTLGRLTNRPENLVHNITIPFDAREVFTSGGAEMGTMQVDVAPTTQQFLDRFDAGNQQYWLYKLQPIRLDGTDIHSQYVYPLRITTWRGDMIRNTAFHIHNGFLIFHEDPEPLFPERQIVVAVGEKDLDNLHSFPLRIPNDKPSEHFVRYSRISQSPADFEKALAVMAGLQVLPETGKLLYKVLGDGQSITYVFENFSINCDYPHIPLTEGTTYPKGLVVGDGVSVKYNDRKGGSWWKAIDFMGGLSMGTVGSKGLVIPDRTVRAYIHSEDPGSVSGSKAHVRLELDGPQDIQEAYWESVALAETKSGIYLNHLLGLTDGDKGVNALDVFFDGVLGITAMVICIDQAMVRDLREVYQFINEQKPVGCTPIVLVRNFTFDDEWSMSDSVQDSAVIYPYAELSVSDTVSLSAVVVDSQDG